MDFAGIVQSALGDPDFAERIQHAFCAASGTPLLTAAYEAGHRGFRPDGTPVAAEHRQAAYDQYLLAKARRDQQHAAPGEVRGIVENALARPDTPDGRPCSWW